MRYLIVILLSFILTKAIGQGPNTTSITVPVNGTGTVYNALQTLPNDYSTATTTRYPLLIFLHGQGEQGSSLSSIYTSSGAGGPAYFNAQNQWPTSFVNPVDGKTYKYIVVSPQAPNGAITPSTNSKQLEFVLDYLIYTLGLRIDTTRIYITGLSAGGEGTLDYPSGKYIDCSNQAFKHKIAAIVPMSADFGASCMQALGDSIANRKIGLWGFGDPNNDVHGANTAGIIFYANQWLVGSGRFTSYTGGHCCWNNFYNPTYTETFGGFTRNIYQWMLQYTVTYPSNKTPWVIGYGEYVNFLLNENTHQSYDNTTGLPTLMTGPTLVTSIAGGPHHGGVIDSLTHSVWMKYDNASGELGDGTTTSRSTLTKITVDSLGNPFNNVAQLLCAGTNHAPFWSTYARKSDGTVWVWGNTQGGILGNGTAGTQASTRPVQVVLPGGRLARKIQGNIMIVALATDGTVWTWGADGNAYMLAQGTSSPSWMSPGQVPLPGGRTAVDIVGAGGYWYIILDNRDILACGFYPDYFGVGSPSISMSPQNITIGLGLPAPIRSMGVNNAGTYAILTTGRLFDWGSNAMGSMGNGDEPDYSNYGLPPLYGASKFPYANDQGLHGLMITHPIEPMKGITTFDTIYTNGALTWTVAIRKTDRTVLSWGRNKTQIPNGVVGANPISGGITSTYPNSWDVPWPTVVNPDSVTAIIQSTSPYCVLNPSGSPCNSFTNPTAAKPTLTVGPNQSLSAGITATTLAATCAAASPYKVTYHIWTLVSGPNVPIISLNSDLNPTVTGLINGTYVFKLKVIDQNWRSDSLTMNVLVGTAPTVNAGADKVLVLPTTSTTLVGTATANGGATIASVQWTQLSGPNTATIVSPTSTTTNITGLVAQVYQFQLSATDSNGQTSNDTVFVTVNPAPSNTGKIKRGMGFKHKYKVI